MTAVDELRRLTTEPAGFETAMVAVVNALASALAQKGVLPLSDYRDELRRVWDEMPEIDAQGPAGALFEQVISTLNASIPKSSIAAPTPRPGEKR